MRGALAQHVPERGFDVASFTLSYIHIFFFHIIIIGKPVKIANRFCKGMRFRFRLRESGCRGLRAEGRTEALGCGADWRTRQEGGGEGWEEPQSAGAAPHYGFRVWGLGFRV